MGDIGSTRVFGYAGRGVVTMGLQRRPLNDLYHWLVTGPWARLLLVYALVYFSTQAIFGGARLLVSGGTTPLVEALLSRPPPQVDAPAVSMRAFAAAALGAVDRFVHWVELVIGASLVIAKFSNVRARILFSRVAVVAPHGGGRALMFRMANERPGHIVDAKISVLLVRNEASEGEIIRRAHDLALARGGTALFSHAWTAIHHVTKESPLHGEDEASLEAAEAEIIVNVSGFDERLLRTMYARHVYGAGRIVWNARFKDIVRILPDGTRALDYGRFHRTVPAESPEETPTRKAR